MTLSPRKKEQLGVFLGSLPNAAAVKLFGALEADRAKGGKGLPHMALIDDLRAQLLQRGAMPPPRRLDAKRMFSPRSKISSLVCAMEKSAVHGSPGLRWSRSGGS